MENLLTLIVDYSTGQIINGERVWTGGEIRTIEISHNDKGEITNVSGYIERMSDGKITIKKYRYLELLSLLVVNNKEVQKRLKEKRSEVYVDKSEYIEIKKVM